MFIASLLQLLETGRSLQYVKCKGPLCLNRQRFRMLMNDLRMMMIMITIIITLIAAHSVMFVSITGSKINSWLNRYRVGTITWVVVYQYFKHCAQWAALLALFADSVQQPTCSYTNCIHHQSWSSRPNFNLSSSTLCHLPVNIAIVSCHAVKWTFSSKS